MRRALSLLLRIGVVAGCLAYVLWDLDFARLGRALADFRLIGVVLMAVVMWISFAFGGLRLSFIAGRRISVFNGFNADVLGLGLSNLLPAKAGEVAKILYLKRQGPLVMSESLSIVFWERFFDLNAILLLGLGAAFFMEMKAVVLLLGGLAAALWLWLLAIRISPTMAEALSKMLIFDKVKRFAANAMRDMAGRLEPRFIILLALYTLPIWICYFLEYYFLLRWAAQFDLALPAVAVVFVMGALGLATPASPGALGVYEAVMVAALGMQGVDKENAVAAGLVFRFFQYVPVTLYASLVLAQKGLTIRSIREEASRRDEE